jgi:hypothetical protein
MKTVGIPNAEEFWNKVNEKKLPEKFGIKLGRPSIQPYGKEVNIFDLAEFAGALWKGKGKINNTISITIGHFHNKHRLSDL